MCTFCKSKQKTEKYFDASSEFVIDSVLANPGFEYIRKAYDSKIESPAHLQEAVSGMFKAESVIPDQKYMIGTYVGMVVEVKVSADADVNSRRQLAVQMLTANEYNLVNKYGKSYVLDANIERSENLAKEKAKLERRILKLESMKYDVLEQVIQLQLQLADIEGEIAALQESVGDIKDDMYPLGVLVSCMGKGQPFAAVVWEFYWLENHKTVRYYVVCRSCDTEDANKVARALKFYLEKCRSRFL